MREKVPKSKQVQKGAGRESEVRSGTHPSSARELGTKQHTRHKENRTTDNYPAGDKGKTGTIYKGWIRCTI